MPKQSTKKTFYLAGPMSGIAKFNFPAFDEAAKDLRGHGYKIVSPAELDNPKTRAQALRSRKGIAGKQTHTWGDFLARDVKLIADKVKGIIFMPGWALSRGARLEAYVGLLCQHEFHQYLGRGSLKRLKPKRVMEIIQGGTMLDYWEEWGEK